MKHSNTCFNVCHLCLYRRIKLLRENWWTFTKIWKYVLCLSLAMNTGMSWNFDIFFTGVEGIVTQRGRIKLFLSTINWYHLLYSSNSKYLMKTSASVLDYLLQIFGKFYEYNIENLTLLFTIALLRLFYVQNMIFVYTFSIY